MFRVKKRSNSSVILNKSCPTIKRAYIECTYSDIQPKLLESDLDLVNEYHDQKRRHTTHVLGFQAEFHVPFYSHCPEKVADITPKNYYSVGHVRKHSVEQRHFFEGLFWLDSGFRIRSARCRGDGSNFEASVLSRHITFPAFAQIQVCIFQGHEMTPSITPPL